VLIPSYNTGAPLFDTVTMYARLSPRWFPACYR
jgi:hypothetical protein